MYEPLKITRRAHEGRVLHSKVQGAPQGRQRLAAGGAKRNPRKEQPQNYESPGGATDINKMMEHE